MKILILAWRDIKHPLAGGAEKVMHAHAQAWAQSGHNVTLFTSAHLHSPKREKIGGVEVVRRGYELLGVQIAAFYWYVFGKHPKFDLVVDQFHGIPFFTPGYIRIKKLAVIQEVAKEVWLLNHLPFPINYIVGAIGYLFEPLIYLFYKKIPFMTGSQSAKSDLINFGIPKKNISIIHHGISYPSRQVSYKKEKIKTVMFLGALTKDKGIEDAVDVFSKLNRDSPNYRFWVVGKGGGTYFNSIKAKVEKIGLKNKVKFLGYVSEKKKYELLQKAHVIIHPSVREGWGLTVVEASLVGTPSVGYDVAGLRDSIRPGINGVLIPYKNTNKMARVVGKLLGDKENLKRLSNSSRKYAKRFTWAKSSKLSLKLLEQIVLSLNILILNWKDVGHPEGGGAEQATLEHAKTWQKAGHKVTWLASYYPGSNRFEKLDGIKIVRYGTQFIGVQFAAFLWYLFGNHEDFDVVVDQFHGIPFFTPIYVRVKKLAYIHEVAKEVWTLNHWPKPFNLIPAVLGQFFEPWIFRIFYQRVPFMTVSESTKQDLLEWGINERNISVIYNGVSLESVPNRSLKRHSKTAIFLGTLSRDKGIEDAIYAFSFIYKIDSEWRFWIVGKGEDKYTAKLLKKCRELGLNGKVKFWGYVDTEKKFKLLSHAIVLINPSIREGWGLVNIEANSVGTPVVAYNVSGVKDSVLDSVTGLLSEAGDSHALAANVLELARNKQLYKKLASSGFTWSKRFTWSKAGRESLDLIENLR